MSSHKKAQNKRPLGRRKVLALIGAAILGGPALSACQPLYGTSSSGAAMKDLMASVSISTIPGRVGQRIRNELIFATTRGGYAAEQIYRLDIAVRESVSSSLVESTGEARAELFNLTAEFTLVRIADDEPVFKGKSNARAAFDRFEQIFTNVRGRIDAENRAAATVADSIRTRVASYLSAVA